MLRILLKEFRCWKNLSIDIPFGEVTLIKGDSGCGKSTILQAIVWCLYGKIQLVTPITKKVANTEVTLELPYYFNGKKDVLNITRKKSTRVTLSHYKDIYEDKVAQEIINDLFGTYELWLASCYVGQGTRNTFLTAPNSGKMELLNSIAFHEEDPRIFIDKITEVLNEKNIIYDIKLKEYNSGISSLELMMSKIDINKALSEQQHKNLLREINILNSELLNLQIVKNQYDINIGILNNLYKQLSNLQDIILPEPTVDLRNLMIKYNYNDEYDYHKINNTIMLLYQRDVALENGPLDDDLPVFNMDDYRNIVNNENIYNDNYKLSLNVNCNYDQESITSCIKNMKDAILYYEYLQINNEYQLLINHNISYTDTNDLLKELDDINIKKLEITEIQYLEDSIPDYSKYDRSFLQNDIMILQQKLLQPIINKNDDEYAIIKQKIENLNDKLKNIRQNTDIDSLNIILSNLTNNLNNVKNEIYKLKLNNKVLKCPKCSESLNFEKDELVLSNNHLSSIELDSKHIEHDIILDEIKLINQKILDTKENLNDQFNNINAEIKILSNQILIYDKEYDELKFDYSKEINNEISLINKKIEILKFEEQTVKFTYEKNISIKKSELLQEKINKMSKLNDEHNKLELKITKLNNDNNIHLNNQKQIKILELKLNEYKDINQSVSYKLNEINDFKDKIQKLSNIKVVQKPLYKSEYILKCIDHNDRKNKYIDVINKIPLIWRGEKIDDVKFYNEKVNEYINLLNITKTKKTQVDLNRKIINDQIGKIQIIDDPINRIIEITNLINQYKNDIISSNEANKIVDYRDKLISDREIITKMNSDLVNLQLLKQHALETECKSLQDVISSINSSIENICSNLFDKEISIVLSLFKTIKSTKSIKPNVNFQISYKGGIFDNINNLSGGEGDRTSIALTLALYRLTSFPLLMLDETLASLHYDMKEATVETISNIINQDKNRCVIVILHDSVNGIFSNVIDLEEITEGRY
jgi:DNA repair exonuclease SbcCD ATPase subunit